MILLLQRVKSASVTIEGEVCSGIGKGLLVFLGVEKGDGLGEAQWLANKLAALRVFEDENDKMNLSVKDVGGEILVVSQFTLAGNCKKGTRPSFDNAMEPGAAKDLYEKFCALVSAQGAVVKTGVFGAMMDVSLINDGPVTFILEKC